MLLGFDRLRLKNRRTVTQRGFSQRMPVVVVAASGAFRLRQEADDLVAGFVERLKDRQRKSVGSHHHKSEWQCRYGRVEG